MSYNISQRDVRHEWPAPNVLPSPVVVHSNREDSIAKMLLSQKSVNQAQRNHSGNMPQHICRSVQPAWEKLL